MFLTRLERLEATLALPQPQRGRVLDELAADVEDLYRAYRAQGLDAAEAERRSLALLLPDAAAIADLERLHRPLYARMVSRLTHARRSHAERAAVIGLSVVVLALTLAGLPLPLLLFDPSPFLLPVLGLGVAGVVSGAVCAFRVFVRGVATAAEGARGLDWILAFASAGPFVAVFGFTLDLYVALGAVLGDGDRAAAILTRLLRADGALLASALALSLASGLIWLVVQARLALVREAVLPRRFGQRLALLAATGNREVA